MLYTYVHKLLMPRTFTHVSHRTYGETWLRQPPVGLLKLTIVERWLLYRDRFQCISATYLGPGKLAVSERWLPYAVTI